ncbi:MAG: radical SAM protein, partial [Desulfuromonadales bacterium]|nr:radical SAM protein [Desulfuromonadales bacterium]
MRILLISPNTLTTPYPVYPIGLDYVAAAVADRHQVRIADLNLLTRDDLAQLLSDFAPEVIGLSCRNIDNTDADAPLPFIDDYRELVSWLRRHTPATLVCGGSGFTIMPAAFFAAVNCDYGIIGEGERFGPFIEALEAGHEVTGLDGVISARRPDCYPPPWEGAPARAFDPSSSHHAFYLANGGMMNLQTKRGCTFRCIYCPYPHIEGKRHRLQPPEQVARTARLLQDAGARYLFITDSAFNSDVAHSLEVARAFHKEGLSIPWGGFFAPIRTDPDYFQIMKDSGLTHVEFGTESLSDTMLHTYRKPFTSADVFAAHRLARGAGLHVAHYFLLGGPGESEATLQTTLEHAEQL